MRVLVTRPEGDAEETAARLAEHGCDFVIAPLLEIVQREGPAITLDGVQAILVTSANGIRALANRTAQRDVPVFAVGRQSASVAGELGFLRVRDAGGNATALANLVAAQLRPDGGALVHAAGADTRGDLAGKLGARGFAVRSEVLYDAVAATKLPDAAIDALKRGEIDAAMFFSPRTAAIFAQLATRAGLEQACKKTAALCISRAAAQELSSLEFGNVRVAAHPDQDALLALLDTERGVQP